MTRLIGVSRCLYQHLLICYPSELRSRFGTEMADVFEDLLCEAVAERGVSGVLSSWRTALWELLTIAGPRRFNETTLMACALSFVISSALFLAFFRAVS